MKNELKIRKGENLHDWCVRIAKHYDGKMIKADDLKEVLREVCVKSYAHGSSDAIQAIKNPLRRI